MTMTNPPHNPQNFFMLALTLFRPELLWAFPIRDDLCVGKIKTVNVMACAKLKQDNAHTNSNKHR